MILKLRQKELTCCGLRIAFGMNFHGFGVVATQGENLFPIFAGNFFFLRTTTNLIRTGSRLPRNVIVADGITAQKWASASFWNLSCNEKNAKLKKWVHSWGHWRGSREGTKSHAMHKFCCYYTSIHQIFYLSLFLTFEPAFMLLFTQFYRPMIFFFSELNQLESIIFYHKIEAHDMVSKFV